MDLDLRAVSDLAISLARGGGELARRAAGTGQGLELDEAGVPEVAHDVERRIRHRLQVRPDDGTTWRVDPLVGLDNFLLGVELQGVAIGVTDGSGRLVEVLHDAVSGRTAWAARGLGAWQEGRRLRVDAPDGPDRSDVVAWAATARPTPVFEESFARVLRTGAPTLDWVLAASGRVAAAVDGPDPVAGPLLVGEAGGDLVPVHGRQVGELLVGGRDAHDVAARLSS